MKIYYPKNRVAPLKPSKFPPAFILSLPLHMWPYSNIKDNLAVFELRVFTSAWVLPFFTILSSGQRCNSVQCCGSLFI